VDPLFQKTSKLEGSTQLLVYPFQLTDRLQERQLSAGLNGTHPLLGRLRQKDLEFKASLGYIARPCLRKQSNRVRERKGERKGKGEGEGHKDWQLSV
jgi:hypothetical protein